MLVAIADPAFLSVRLPLLARDRLKAAAAARGKTVQELVGTLVERFLAEEKLRRAPELASVLGALRAGAPALRARGVRRLWVAGPVSRGEARPDAGVEVVCEFEPEARVSLVGLASLRAELSALLGVPAHLAELDSTRPAAAREAARRDAVRAL
jgi:predicted nucleotidyltransferase